MLIRLTRIREGADGQRVRVPYVMQAHHLERLEALSDNPEDGTLIGYEDPPGAPPPFMRADAGLPGNAQIPIVVAESCDEILQLMDPEPYNPFQFMVGAALRQIANIFDPPAPLTEAEFEFGRQVAARLA